MDKYKLHEMMTEIQMKHGIDELKNMLTTWKSEQYYADLVLIHIPHPTEQKYPVMCLRFKEIQAEMYATFLAKNNDYSKWNINATGIVGLVTRFWDKAARIMNLAGFDIGTGEYTGIKDPLVKDEKLPDTFGDASVYGVIARIYLEGKWGK